MASRFPALTSNRVCIFALLSICAIAQGLPVTRSQARAAEPSEVGARSSPRGWLAAQEAQRRQTQQRPQQWAEPCLTHNSPPLANTLISEDERQSTVQTPARLSEASISNLRPASPAGGGGAEDGEYYAARDTSEGSRDRTLEGILMPVLASAVASFGLGFWIGQQTSPRVSRQGGGAEARRGVAKEEAAGQGRTVAREEAAGRLPPNAEQGGIPDHFVPARPSQTDGHVEQASETCSSLDDSGDESVARHAAGNGQGKFEDESEARPALWDGRESAGRGVEVEGEEASPSSMGVSEEDMQELRGMGRTAHASIHEAGYGAAESKIQPAAEIREASYKPSYGAAESTIEAAAEIGEASIEPYSRVPEALDGSGEAMMGASIDARVGIVEDSVADESVSSQHLWRGQENDARVGNVEVPVTDESVSSQHRWRGQESHQLGGFVSEASSPFPPGTARGRGAEDAGTAQVVNSATRGNVQHMGNTGLRVDLAETPAGTRGSDPRFRGDLAEPLATTRGDLAEPLAATHGLDPSLRFLVHDAGLVDTGNSGAGLGVSSQAWQKSTSVPPVQGIAPGETHSPWTTPPPPRTGHRDRCNGAQGFITPESCIEGVHRVHASRLTTHEAGAETGELPSRRMGAGWTGGPSSRFAMHTPEARIRTAASEAPSSLAKVAHWQEASALVAELAGMLDLDLADMSGGQRLQLMTATIQALGHFQQRGQHQEITQLQQEANKHTAWQAFWAGEGVAVRRSKLMHLLQKERLHHLRAALADSLFAGLCIMLLTCLTCGLRYGVLGHQLGMCPSWTDLPRVTLTRPWAWLEGFRVLACWGRVLRDALLGAGIMLGVAWFLGRGRILENPHTAPLRTLAIGLGGVCGLAGWVAVGQLGGRPGVWLLAWEGWLGLHVAAAYYMPPTSGPGRQSWTAFLAGGASHVLLTLVLPVFVSFAPFAHTTSLQNVLNDLHRLIRSMLAPMAQQ